MDATIIYTGPSPKSQSTERDPEMYQICKGQQWYFGMKAHIDVGMESGLVHTVTTTAANVTDVNKMEGQRGDMTKRGRTWYIAVKHGNTEAMA